MNNFNNSTIYISNLMKTINGKSELYKSNAFLLYEEKTDRFYSLEDTFNEFLDIKLNKNLTEKERENCYKKIKQHEYPYTQSGQEGEIYVDINLIKILENGDVNGKTRT